MFAHSSVVFSLTRLNPLLKAVNIAPCCSDRPYSHRSLLTQNISAARAARAARAYRSCALQRSTPMQRALERRASGRADPHGLGCLQTTQAAGAALRLSELALYLDFH